MDGIRPGKRWASGLATVALALALHTSAWAQSSAFEGLKRPAASEVGDENAKSGSPERDLSSQAPTLRGLVPAPLPAPTAALAETAVLASGEELGLDRYRPLGTGSDSFAPRLMRADWAAKRAAVLEWAGDAEAARDAYALAAALGENSLSTWRGLGRTRVRSGRLEAGEAAFQIALQREGIPFAEEGRVLAELGETQLLQRRASEAVATLERALQRAPSTPRAPELLSRAREEADGSPRTTAFPLWPIPERTLARGPLEDALRGMVDALPDPARDWLLGATPRDRGNAWLALALLFVAFGLERGIRGRGEVVAALGYPEELEGSFTVRISPRQSKAPARRGTRSPATGKRSGHALAEAGASASRSSASVQAGNRTEHTLVARWAHFKRLRPGRYFVSIEGTLRAREGGETVLECSEEQAVVVRGRRATRCEFELAPTECRVDVFVHFDKQTPSHAGVTVRGLPHALRYTRDGKVQLALPAGKHALVVGSGDRVAECEIEVEAFRPLHCDLDLAGTEHLLFKGCPPAVEPFLRGDISAAARALERDGHEQGAHLVLARFHAEHGESARAAEHFAMGGELIEAARLREGLEQWDQAAALYEAGGDMRRAALFFRKAGELVRAGRAYESLRLLDSAADCFREAGDVPSLIAALEQSGAFYDAAEVAIAKEDRSEAIRLLGQVSDQDPRYAEACESLIDAYAQEGQGELAADALAALERAAGATGVPAELHYRVAALLDESGDTLRALDLFQALRESQPEFKDVSTRIEDLKKRLSQKAGHGGNVTRASTGSDPAHVPHPLLAGNRYELIKEIGRGGMGVVYQARDGRLGRVVALKRLPDTLKDHPKAVELFLNEAQSCARLNHRNIVTVYDVDQEDGVYFITMELLEGRPLNQVLKKKGQLSYRDSARLGIQIATGLEYAHQERIVHRDIKTANLFLNRDKSIKIMDFGLAKMMAEVRRATTVIGGTPYYMAPEQALGKSVDHRADLYSLGVTLYELATGSLPFTEGDVVYQHRHVAVPDPREHAPDLPEAFVDAILKLMAKQADDRPQGAGEVIRVLEPFIHA